MASSSSSSRRYDVFPSFSGEDVRKSFLSHLLKELERKTIKTFLDHGIERSRPIGAEILSAIRESRISIVVFSKNYASSTWCLNELVEIHKCHMEDQTVIPVFYDVDPSEVRKQTGEFGNVFEETCKGKTEDQRQRWMKVLEEVANMAGEDLRNWSNEADMIGKIADDVSKKLITPSSGFGDFVGIEAHLEAMYSLLCLESEEARMVGIVGASGIGKSTIGRALFSQLSSEFDNRAFVAYKRTIRDDYGMKLCWEQQFLLEILGQKELKISKLGAVEQRLKHKKVLIVLDDVDDLELLKTLVGETGWFGSGSRIVVITQDRQLLKAHEIDLTYEVKIPSEDLALKMLCRSAFRQDSPPDGFMELAFEVAMLAGNLPLGLSVLGSSLRRKEKKEWMEMLPRLQNGLDGKIEKTLRVGYDRLDGKEQELFLLIAFAGFDALEIKDLLGDSVNTGLKMLADKSLIRITPHKYIEMHNLLRKLGREIVRAESTNNPGKRRFLEDVEDTLDVFTDRTGTETVLGIFLNTREIEEPFSIDEKSLKGMRNLLFLVVLGYVGHRTPAGEGSLRLPQGLAYLPRKLRLLKWDGYPSKCLPSSFKADCLVELRMENSSLENLWPGVLPLGSLKKMIMSWSEYLKELPDLSNAINLEVVYVKRCTSLVTFPSSIQNLLKLRELDLEGCTKLESFPALVNLKSLEYLNLRECSRLRNFLQIYMNSSDGIRIEVEDCFLNKNVRGPDCLVRCMPRKFPPEHLVYLTVKGNTVEKLWEGVQPLRNLKEMNLSGSENLIEFPDLSKATNLESLKLNDCKMLATLPCTIGNLNKLVKLEMQRCTRLEALPTDVNLSSLEILDLSGCSRLRSFPQISRSIIKLYLNDTAIEQVPCSIENFSRLKELSMRGCKKLKNISPHIFSLRHLLEADFSDCGGVETALGDASVVAATMSTEVEHNKFFGNDIDDLEVHLSATFEFNNCFKLDGGARELILRSYFRPTVLPGGEVPTYFTHRASGNSLSLTLPGSYLYPEILGFKICAVVEPQSDPIKSHLEVRWNIRGEKYMINVSHKLELCKTDHLVLVSFKARPMGPPTKLEFEFSTCNAVLSNITIPPRIKECGVRLMSYDECVMQPHPFDVYFPDVYFPDFYSTPPVLSLNS